MRVLITGALGHIGSGYIHALQPGGFEDVALLDNFQTQRYCSLFDLPGGVPFRLIEADVLTADLDSHVAGMDAVIHLAAITNAEASFAIQDEVERVNFEGTARVAQACAKHGVRLIFPSTTSVYGSQDEVVDEDCPIDQLKPQSPYADSKIKAERLLAALAAEGGLRFVACRFGTIYGASPGMRFHTAVNRFAWQACVGQPLTVWRTALHQRRPYLDLADAVRALDFILRTDLFDGAVYNVVTDNLTVNDVVEALRRLVPDLTVNLVDSRIMNQLSYAASSARFRAKGFVFAGDLARALKETVGLLRNVRPRRAGPQ